MTAPVDSAPLGDAADVDQAELRAVEQNSHPVDSWLASVSETAAVPTVQVQSPVPPAIEMVTTSITESESRPVASSSSPRPLVLLPKTAVALPSLGLVFGLIGLALVVHGVRRVRRAAAQLGGQAAALGRLVALLEATASASAEGRRRTKTRSSSDG
jgi:hypothetical protein